MRLYWKEKQHADKCGWGTFGVLGSWYPLFELKRAKSYLFSQLI